MTDLDSRLDQAAGALRRAVEPVPVSPDGPRSGGGVLVTAAVAAVLVLAVGGAAALRADEREATTNAGPELHRPGPIAEGDGPGFRWSVYRDDEGDLCGSVDEGVSGAGVCDTTDAVPSATTLHRNDGTAVGSFGRAPEGTGELVLVTADGPAVTPGRISAGSPATYVVLWSAADPPVRIVFRDADGTDLGGVALDT
jgi:hypothetical protein